MADDLKPCQHDEALSCLHWPGQEHCHVCGFDAERPRDDLDDMDDDDLEAWLGDR